MFVATADGRPDGTDKRRAVTALMKTHMILAGDLESHPGREQGTKMGRRTILHVCIQGENGRVGIDVGGYVTPLTEAMMRF